MDDYLYDIISFSPMLLSDKLRYLREVEGSLRGLGRAMSLRELSDTIRAETGANMPVRLISNLEAGEKLIGKKNRFLLARFYKVHPGYLVDDDPTERFSEDVKPLRSRSASKPADKEHQFADIVMKQLELAFQNNRAETLNTTKFRALTANVIANIFQRKATAGLTVFLCHSSGNKGRIRQLRDRLVEDGFQPWLDEDRLLPGKEWETEITRAVRASRVVLVCLSRKSATKEGFVQKEIRLALNVADEKPDGSVYIIPVRLENCVVPERLRKWQWVDLFKPEGYDSLLRSLLELTLMS